MLRVLRNRDFALLWFGGLISMTGNWMLFVALPVYVYQTTGSTLATGLMFMAATLPSLLLGSVAGVFVDRWDRRRTMVACNLLMALALIPLVFVPSTGWLWLVYLVSLLRSSLAQFFAPAENALLPTLVGREQLVPANALNALNNNLARLAGPAAGGLVMGIWGLHAVVILDAASYVAAAVTIGLIAAPRPAAQGAGASASALGAPGSVWREWRDGLRTVRRSPVVVLLFLVTALGSLGEGVMAVLFVPFVTEVLRGDALQLGWLLSAQAIGGLAGGAVIGWLGGKIPPASLLGLGALLLGLIDLVVFNYPAFYPGIGLALALMVVVGVPASGIGAGFSTLVQTHVPDPFLGRVFGAIGASAALLLLTGMAAASALGDVFGIVPVINTQGVVHIVGGVVALTLLRWRLSLHAPQSLATLEG